METCYTKFDLVTNYNSTYDLSNYISYYGTQSELTEGLVDRQVGFHHKHGRSHHVGFLKHVPTFPVQHAVDPTDHRLWALQGEEACHS